MFYKFLLSFVVAFILTGCSDQNIFQVHPSEGLDIKEQSTGPLPWITFIPSESARNYHEFLPERIAQHVRFSLAAFPKKSKFSHIKFITLDYKEETINSKATGNTEQSALTESNIEKERSYFLKLGFYHKNPELGGIPIFQGQIQLLKSKIYPNEAFKLMAEHLIDDIAVSPLSDVTIKMYE